MAALLIGGGAAPAFACYTGSFTGGHTNAGATICIVVQNTSFTGNLSNTGTIAPGNPTDILISGSTITGSVTNSGTISGGAGIVIENSTITAQTVLAPIGIDDRGLLVATNGLGISIDSHSTVVGSAIGVNVELTGTFSGGLSNAGVILGSDDGINFEFLTTVGGGITNSGTVSGLFGLEVDSVSTFSGGITNSGTITGAGANFGDGAVISRIGTFTGGISNGGLIKGEFTAGLNVQTITVFSGGITNSGTISATGGANPSFGRALWVGTSNPGGAVLSFSGGITNTGTGVIQSQKTAVLVKYGDTFGGGILNAGTISSNSRTGISVNGVSNFSGGISNGGTISAAQFGVDVAVSIFSGGISNSGTISGGVGQVGIEARTFTTFSGGIDNSGTISAGIGIQTQGGTAFSEGISNGGKISGTTGGIIVTNLKSFSGGITNNGTVNAPFAIAVGSVSSFGGGITNSGTVTNAQFGAEVLTVSTFSGGIGNSGTISASSFGLDVQAVSTFSGGISNGGAITATGEGIALVTSAGRAVLTFTGGGITNTGTISAGQFGVQLFNVRNFAGGIDNGSSGLIAGQAAAIDVFAGSTFAGGISNGGTISGGTGILANSIHSFAGGITNGGSIIASGNGIVVTAVTQFGTSLAGGISNAGKISAAGVGVEFSNVSTFVAGTQAGGITNTGTISGSTGILVGGSAAIAIFDSGVIVGTGGTAVDLSANAAGNIFTLGPGYNITGKVLGQGADTFQLGGSGNAVFSLGNFGSGQQYQGFAAFNVVGGSWTLTGANTTAFPFTVTNGTAIVTGAMDASSTTVNSGGVLVVDGTLSDPTINLGGVLSGTGSVGATTINAGGTLAPGPVGGIGTLTINGGLTFNAGSTYAVMLTPSASSNTAVNGAAALTGGTVNAQFAAGHYVGRQYTILTTTGGLGGTSFAGLTNVNLPVGFTDSLSYNADDVFLNISALLGQGAALNQNQQNVANSINAFFNNGGTLPTAIGNLFNLTGSNLERSLAQIDGEDATGAAHSAFILMDNFLDLMLDPFVYGRGGPASGGGALGFAPDQQASFPSDIALAYAGLLKAPPKQNFDQRWTVWGSSFGGSGTFDGNATVGSNNVTASTYGFAAGADYHVNPDTVLGFAMAGSGTGWNLANTLGTGRSDAFQAGAYGTHYFGPAYLSAAFAFTNNWFTTNRTALGDQLTARFNGQSYGARLEGGFRFAVAPTAGVTPYAAIQAQDFHTPSFSETDLTGGGLGLSFNSQNATDTRSELGARFDALTAWGAMPVQLRARIAWAHDWVSNTALDAAFQALPGTSFVVNGAAVPANSALASVGAELHLTPRWTLIGKFDGEFASSAQTYAGSGTLRYQW